MSALVEMGSPLARSPRFARGRRALRALLHTRPDWTPTIERVTLGGVVLVHGMQKAFGWFGGGGISGTVDFFQSVLHLPAAVAVGVVRVEPGRGSRAGAGQALAASSSTRCTRSSPIAAQSRTSSPRRPPA